MRETPHCQGSTGIQTGYRFRQRQHEGHEARAFKERRHTSYRSGHGDASNHGYPFETRLTAKLCTSGSPFDLLLHRPQSLEPTIQHRNISRVSVAGDSKRDWACGGGLPSRSPRSICDSSLLATNRLTHRQKFGAAARCVAHGAITKFLTRRGSPLILASDWISGIVSSKLFCDMSSIPIFA